MGDGHAPDHLAQLLVHEDQIEAIRVGRPRPGQIGTPLASKGDKKLSATIKTQTDSFPFPIWWYPFVIVYGFLTDVLLTFVTSALAYTTNRVGVAWSIGTKMIKETWPASAAYTFVPPITLLAFATLNPIRLPAPLVVSLAVISTLVGLLVKGAIAAFYLRHAALPTTGGEAQLRA